MGSIEFSNAVSSRFRTTRWTMVLAAGGGKNRDSNEALQALCRAYWYPLYAFVRRSGYTPEDAEDLTQAFFQRLLAQDFFRLADPEKGRFRTFLLVALKRFIANEWRKNHAAKRGGGALHFSFNASEGESRFTAEPVDRKSPEVLYDRQWALTVVERSLERLRLHYEGSGRGELFQHLKDFLTVSSRDAELSTAAAKAGLTENAAYVAVHRLRKRFREHFRLELAETVAPGRVEEEMLRLKEILSGDV